MLNLFSARGEKLEAVPKITIKRVTPASGAGCHLGIPPEPLPYREHTGWQRLQQPAAAVMVMFFELAFSNLRLMTVGGVVEPF